MSNQSSTQGFGATSGFGQNQYATSQSQYSHFDETTTRGRQQAKVRRLIEQGKRVAEREKITEEQRKAKTKQQEKNGKGGKGRQSGQPKKEEEKLSIKEQALISFNERQATLMKDRRIGPFSFCIEPDLDVEILDKNQVFDDLVALEEILYNTSEPKPVTTKGKKK